MFNETTLFYTLIFAIIACFCALLVLHIYFRIKVFYAYKKLVQNRVDIDVKAIFSDRMIREEVVPRYPDFEKEILSFVKNLKRAMTLASLFLILILLLGGLLMYNRS